MEKIAGEAVSLSLNDLPLSPSHQRNSTPTYPSHYVACRTPRRLPEITKSFKYESHLTGERSFEKHVLCYLVPYTAILYSIGCVGVFINIIQAS